MASEQLYAFLQAVKADPELQQKLKAAAGMEAVLAMAKQAGFAISADDMQVGELSDAELEGVAAGLCEATCILGQERPTAWYVWEPV